MGMGEEERKVTIETCFGKNYSKGGAALNDLALSLFRAAELQELYNAICE